VSIKTKIFDAGIKLARDVAPQYVVYGAIGLAVLGVLAVYDAASKLKDLDLDDLYSDYDGD